MAKLILPNGDIALLDDEDLDRVKKFTWYCIRHHGNKYVVSTHRTNDIRMHRFIMGLTNPKISIDHINGNGLDNRKINLRIASTTENSRNRKCYKQKRSPNASKYKGVSWKDQPTHWQARIMVDRKSKSLGYFKTEEEAATAYNRAAKKYFGEFARLNVIERK